MRCVVWSIHTKTQIVGRRQPMTSLPTRVIGGYGTCHSEVTDLALCATKQAATAMGSGGNGETSVGKPGRYWEEREGLSSFLFFYFLLVPLPRLQVGKEGGVGQRELGKNWGRWSRRGILNTLVWIRVRLEHLLPSLRGPVICPHFPLSNSPATTVNSTWPRLGGNILRLTLQFLCWTYDVLVKLYVS